MLPSILRDLKRGSTREDLICLSFPETLTALTGTLLEPSQTTFTLLGWVFFFFFASEPHSIASLSQMRRGSLLSQPQAVLQKLACISEGNPLAPRNSRGFLFQTLSPEKDGLSETAPKQVRGGGAALCRTMGLVFVFLFM